MVKKRKINMKILALDLGDKWVGSAISDALGITCRPYQTVELNQLKNFLLKMIKKENISTIVIGKPTTFSGKESEQTKKIINMAEKLKNEINLEVEDKIKWILWDERLSSKRAEALKQRKVKNKEDKIKSHSVAAAFILQTYLDNLSK
ncbi:Holliday junction resolvase RuvX [Candidatus Dependentiae bacterium]|nr:Holliday junction resolvase RuvX [Candidatus Dependentiae bacterium]